MIRVYFLFILGIHFIGTSQTESWGNQALPHIIQAEQERLRSNLGIRFIEVVDKANKKKKQCFWLDSAGRIIYSLRYTAKGRNRTSDTKLSQYKYLSDGSIEWRAWAFLKQRNLNAVHWDSWVVNECSRIHSNIGHFSESRGYSELEWRMDSSILLTPPSILPSKEVYWQVRLTSSKPKTARQGIWEHGNVIRKVDYMVNDGAKNNEIKITNSSQECRMDITTLNTLEFTDTSCTNDSSISFHSTNTLESHCWRVWNESLPTESIPEVTTSPAEIIASCHCKKYFDNWISRGQDTTLYYDRPRRGDTILGIPIIDRNAASERISIYVEQTQSWLMIMHHCSKTTLSLDSNGLISDVLFETATTPSHAESLPSLFIGESYSLRYSNEWPDFDLEPFLAPINEFVDSIPSPIPFPVLTLPSSD